MLHELMKLWRKRAGLTAGEVAATARVDRSTVYLWESPEGRPTPESLAVALELYGVSEDEELQAWRLRGGATVEAA